MESSSGSIAEQEGHQGIVRIHSETLISVTDYYVAAGAPIFSVYTLINGCFLIPTGKSCNVTPNEDVFPTAQKRQ